MREQRRTGLTGRTVATGHRTRRRAHCAGASSGASLPRLRAVTDRPGRRARRRRDRRGRGLRGPLLPGRAARGAAPAPSSSTSWCSTPSSGSRGRWGAELRGRRGARSRTCRRADGARRCRCAAPSPAAAASRPGSSSTAGRSRPGRAGARAREDLVHDVVVEAGRRPARPGAGGRRPRPGRRRPAEPLPSSSRAAAGRWTGRPTTRGTPTVYRPGSTGSVVSIGPRASASADRPGRQHRPRARAAGRPSRRTSAAVLTVARSTTTWLPPGTCTSLGVPVAGGSGASRTVASGPGAASSSELVTRLPAWRPARRPGWPATAAGRRGVGDVGSWPVMPVARLTTPAVTGTSESSDHRDAAAASVCRRQVDLRRPSRPAPRGRPARTARTSPTR